jgi:excisionase family DNA binding protein
MHFRPTLCYGIKALNINGIFCDGEQRFSFSYTQLPLIERPRLTQRGHAPRFIWSVIMSIEQVSSVDPLAVRVAVACQLTGLGRTTIYELIKSGKLRSVKIGRARLIDKASLRAMLESSL